MMQIAKDGAWDEGFSFFSWRWNTRSRGLQNLKLARTRPKSGAGAAE
jgi:hypothetical protein